MKKALKKIALVCALACNVCAFIAPKIQDKATLSFASVKAYANEQTVSASLIAPPSYEEYLPLKDAKDVHSCAGFTAIADGKTIYIYDKTEKTYRIYQHEYTVTKLQFDTTQTLYFLDNATQLYKMDPVRLTPEKTPIVCSNFLLHEDTLFFTNTYGSYSSIRKCKLSDLEGEKTDLLSEIIFFPLLAFEKGELYYTDGGKTLRKINPDKPTDSTLVAIFPYELRSITVSDNLLSCTNASGNFFTYDLFAFNTQSQAEKVSPLFQQAGKFASLSLHEKQVFAVNDNAVLQYSLEENKFKDFSITSAASANNRLNDAAELCLADNYLFIADNGNERISIYDTTKEAFLAPIPTTLTPAYIASNSNTVLIANKTQILLYDLTGKLLFESKNFDGSLIGATHLDENYFLTTDKNEFLSITNRNGEWTLIKTSKTSTKYPSLLTSDAYGNLYVRCNDSVYAYTEESFLSKDASTVEVITELPENVKKLGFDYSGNLYALEGTTLHKYARNQTDKTFTKATAFPLNDRQVCATIPSPKSFAISVSENAAYVLDDNHYLTKRTDLQLPTLKNIPVNGVDKQILQGDYTDFEVVKIQQNALLVRFDFKKLQDAEYFPYQSYFKAEAATQGIKLAATGEYDVLAVYSEKNNRYETYLTYSTSCISMDKTEYYTAYSESEQKTGELTNSVGLYKLPFLSANFEIERMARGSEVTLLGKVENLNLTYFLVQYVNANGELKTGYTPCNYVSAIKSETPEQTIEKGVLDADKGAIGRLVYLLLGFGVVCILTDYLIVRNPKEHKDE